MTTVEQHLLSRHVDLDLHRPVINELENTATFYLWNLSGQLTGYQQYRPGASKDWHNDPKQGRYYTYRTSEHMAVFGVESLHLTPHVVFVTEGIFDAVRLTELGVSAIAVLTCDPSSSVRNFLSSLGRTVVAVCDNNRAGRKLASAGDVAVFAETDLGESSSEFVKNLVDTYC